MFSWLRVRLCLVGYILGGNWICKIIKMGIQNLLPFLEKSTRNCHISEFHDLTVAVDSYCWLHKGARSCAEKLVKGEETDRYIHYCILYIKLLLKYGIKPIMVLDGRRLPAKLKTEQKRSENKIIAKKQAIELLRLGKVEEANKFFKQCIDITPKMALNLIKECRKLNVDCIVAPYESDAQLAFFSTRGIADCIITEDSDLLLFGCKKVLYKMDISGNGQLVEADKLYLSMNLNPQNYTFDKFRYMCILSGCDYTNSLYGIGLKKALKFISMTAESNPERFLQKIPSYLKMRHLTVDDEYITNFLIANATFLHQIVFDPFAKQLIRLNELDFYKEKKELCRNAGDFFNNEKALQLALGNLDPLTMKVSDNWHPTSNKNSIWSDNYRKKSTINTKKKDDSLKIHNFNVEVKSQIGSNYDLDLKQELKIYQVKTSEIGEANENIIPINQSSKSSSPQTSPIIGNNNPFIKKISKFPLTNTNITDDVKSRFFNSSLSATMENIESKDTSQTEKNIKKRKPETKIFSKNKKPHTKQMSLLQMFKNI